MLVGGAGVDTLARTSRFLRLRGRLNDTREGVGDGLLQFARCVEDRQVLLSNSWKTRKAQGMLKQCERCVEICYVLSCQ